MPRPKKPRPAPSQKRIQSDAATMLIMERVAKRAREFRDKTVEELERDGIRIEKSGAVEARLDPASGRGIVEWKNWIFEFDEGDS